MKPEKIQSGNNTFPAKEKLKSRKSIQSLFEERKSFSTSHLRLIYKIIPKSPTPLPLFAVSVPRKIFKRAVDRNLLKRQIREAYRINKAELKTICTKNNLSLEMMWIWTKNERLDYQEINNQIIRVLVSLIKLIHNHHSKVQ